MKEMMQGLFDGSKHLPSSILSRLNSRKAIGVLLLAVIAIAFSLTNPQPTSSAVVENAEKGFLPDPSQTPECATIPPENCVPNPNGGETCCFTEGNGDQRCRFESESCQTFNNPCDPENPVLAFVRTTLTTHSRTDANGGRHFRTRLQIHGTNPTPGQCLIPEARIGWPNRDFGDHRFAFVKTSTNREIINFVKNSGYNSSGPPPETFSDPLSFRIITTGRSPNFTEHAVLHMTRNANGEVTACVSRQRASCETPTE